VGWIPPLVGLAYSPLHFLWSGGWFFGLIVALGAYTLFMRNDRSKLSETEFVAITRGASVHAEIPQASALPVRL
jgi:nucleobase:cation symporter-1, NCS1 family